MKRLWPALFFVLVSAGQAFAQNPDLGGQRIRGEEDPLAPVLIGGGVLAVVIILLFVALFQPWRWFEKRKVRTPRKSRAVEPTEPSPVPERRPYFKPDGET